MTTYFVTRHKGALNWALGHKIEAKRLSHLDPETIRQGDTVIGTLPVHIAAEICARGGVYMHLTMDVPAEARGRELTAHEMERFGARLTPYIVKENHV